MRKKIQYHYIIGQNFLAVGRIDKRVEHESGDQGSN